RATGGCPKIRSTEMELKIHGSANYQKVTRKKIHSPLGIKLSILAPISIVRVATIINSSRVSDSTLMIPILRDIQGSESSLHSSSGS
ncbi:MAG: hypothetical protein AAF212_10825, partial [Verrucomicrobiota bacterium]